MARIETLRQPLDGTVPALVIRLDPNAFHHGTLGAIRSLGRAGVEVHTLLAGSPGPCAGSRYLHRQHSWSVESDDPEEALAQLNAVGDRIGRRCLLIPVDDYCALLLAEHADRLEGRFLLPAVRPDVPRRLADKAALAGLCAELGVPHPDVRLPGSADELAEALRSLGLPVVAKWSKPWLLPPRSGLRSTTVLRSAPEAAALLAQAPIAGSPLLLQRQLPPTPHGDWFVGGYLDAASRWLAGGAGCKERAYPVDAGSTTLGLWLPNPELEALALRLAASVGYRGILDLDVRRDPVTGAYHLLDFNPRVGAQFRLFADRQGLDIVRALHLDLTGREVPPWRPEYGRAFLVENYDALSAARHWRDGRLTVGDWRRSVRDVRECAWFAGDDTRPFTAMLRCSLRLRLRRLAERWRRPLRSTGTAGQEDLRRLQEQRAVLGVEMAPGRLAGQVRRLARMRR